MNESHTTTEPEIIVRSRGPWLTMASEASVPRRGRDLADVSEQRDLAAAIAGDRILKIGAADAILAEFPTADVVDWGNDLVMPGFVDSHTHPVFAATREAEFEMRNLGKSYVEIAQAGGGIRSSVRSLREATEESLAERLRGYADTFLELGTTTLEAKSGYGLSLEDELKSLRAIRRVADSHALDILPTFLGAHEIPDEYRDNRDEYIRILTDEMIPQVAEEGLALFCDVFCEEHVFTVAESRVILEAAQKHGMRVRIHADEIETTGGAELAVEFRACSADHLGAISDEGIRRLAESDVVGTLLPGTTFFLNLENKAPARRLIDAGAAVALATDFNPGSCHTQSMPMILTLGCIHLGMTASEVLQAATVNAAFALGLSDDRGVLQRGMRADLIALDAPTMRFIPYRFGVNPVTRVMKSGRVVVDRK